MISNVDEIFEELNLLNHEPMDEEYLKAYLKCVCEEHLVNADKDVIVGWQNNREMLDMIDEIYNDMPDAIIYLLDKYRPDSPLRREIEAACYMYSINKGLIVCGYASDTTFGYLSDVAEFNVVKARLLGITFILLLAYAIEEVKAETIKEKLKSYATAESAEDAIRTIYKEQPGLIRHLVNKYEIGNELANTIIVCCNKKSIEAGLVESGYDLETDAYERKEREVINLTRSLLSVKNQFYEVSLMRRLWGDEVKSVEN